jgi:hypothetical protein
MGEIDVAWWINAITVVTVFISIAKYWWLGQGVDGVRGQCYTQIVACFLQLAYNALIYSNSPELWGSLLYQPLLLWGLFMSVKGLRNADRHSF